MNEKSRQRWFFRFSLRSLFVLVTLLCCWLGWESSIVRRRQNALNELRANPAFRFTMADDWAKIWAGTQPPAPVTKIPLVRSWLGDKAVQEITYYSYVHTPSKAEIARAAKTFPEANVHEEEPPTEPCHPGCFPSGTLVETPQGRRSIETIQPGERVSSVLPGGATSAVTVKSVFITDNLLWEIDTDQGSLLTTETQPLCLATGETLPTGKLQPGDVILSRPDGESTPATVRSVTETGRVEKVFNLILGDSEIFVAGGFLARSKPPRELAAGSPESQ